MKEPPVITGIVAISPSAATIAPSTALGTRTPSTKPDWNHKTAPSTGSVDSRGVAIASLLLLNAKSGKGVPLSF